MMLRSALVLVLGLLLVPVRLPAQAPAADTAVEARMLAALHNISSHTLQDYVVEMCSEKYAGRLTGTPGYDSVAQWAANLFREWGIRPAGDDGTYLQRFPNPYTLVLPGASLALHLPVGRGQTVLRPYVFEEEFFPGSTSDSGELTAEVVYVGYGTTAPELGYDDYRGVDVRGKIVLMEPEAPVGPNQDTALFKRWRPYSFHDYKVRNAREHGAAGMLYNYHLANPNSVFAEGLLQTYVSPRVVDDIFAGTGRKHADVVAGIRKQLRPASFRTGKIVTMKNVTEHHPEGVGSNIIGWIEGSDPELRDEAIVIGAHIDHLGLNHELMPGAHDNASGSAVLLAVAEALAQGGVPLRRSVVFILFGAEEQGVKGSEFYVANPFVPNEKVKAFINLESVGRGDRLVGLAGRNFPAVWAAFERANDRFVHRTMTATFNPNLGRPRQDAAHFLWAGVPTISFGSRGGKPLPYATYHTTKDAPNIMTPEIMEDLARIVYVGVIELANEDKGIATR